MTRRIIGIILLAAGLVLIGISVYIKKEVEEGKLKIARGQEQVDEGKKLFDLTPFSKPIGEELTAPAQERIEQGKRDVITYEELSNGLMIGGVILSILGILLIVIPKRKSRSRR